MDPVTIQALEGVQLTPEQEKEFHAKAGAAHQDMVGGVLSVLGYVKLIAGLITEILSAVPTPTRPNDPVTVTGAGGSS